MVYDDTPPCSLHGDEGLESSFPCNISKIRLSEEEYGEHDDERSQECDAMDEESPIFDKGMDDDYWTYIRNPFLLYQKREVSIWRPLEILVWKRIM